MIDANAWIVSARLIAKEQATLMESKDTLHKKLKEEERRIHKQTPSMLAQKTDALCQGDLELTIPYGHISFSTNYVADLVGEEITVTQNLSIVNKSGVDIEANTAMFYYRRANQYVGVTHFSPWVVSKYEPRKKRMYKKAKVSAAAMMELSMPADSYAAGDVMPAPVVSYEDAREYKIKNLSLPSIGTPLEVQVQTWKSALACEIKAYPYRNTKAFEVCSFTPKYQIDANRWKIKSGNEVINEQATGEYRKGKYQLYTQIEEDIKIVRTPIVKKERETGIFGGTARKKDGFILVLTNKSNKVKKLTLIERIPTSTTSEITAKLLSINSVEKVDYKILKEGKIEMDIMLNANEIKKIEVLFEISYDKDLKVKY